MTSSTEVEGQDRLLRPALGPPRTHLVPDPAGPQDHHLGTPSRLRKQDFLFTRGNAESVRLLVAGERDSLAADLSQNVVTAKEKGQSIEAYILEDGVVTNENYLASSRAAQPERRQAVIEVLTSAEGQELVAKCGSYIPTHPDAKIRPACPSCRTEDHSSPTRTLAARPRRKFLEQFDAVFNRQ